MVISLYDEAEKAKMLAHWLQEREERRQEREEDLVAFLDEREPAYFDDLFDIYEESVQEHIDAVMYDNWKSEYYEQYRLCDEEAAALACFTEGYIFYRFENEAPDACFRTSFYNLYHHLHCPMEHFLSHRNCSVVFEGNDLIIRKEPYGSYLTRTAKPAKKETDYANLPTSFVAVDFETLYPQRVSACSVGMVKYKDGEIVDRYYTLIQPPFDYPGKCGNVLTWVHGITEEMVENEKTFDELLPEIEKFVEGLPLVAHNACVEKACIRDTCAYYDIETSIDYENIIDTLCMSRKAETKLGISINGPGTHTLDALCRRFGLSGDNHHHALSDAEMSGNLMLVFRRVFAGESVEVVAESEQTQEQPEETEQQKKYNPEDMVQRTDLENVAENPFKDKVVVLTGFAKCDSQEYGHQLNELGAIIKENVVKKTNILITGCNAGPAKMQKAEELGARIMTEEEYLEIISKLKQHHSV